MCSLGVNDAWDACTLVAGLGSNQMAPLPYVFHDCHTVMIEVIASRKEEDVPHLQQTCYAEAKG